MTGTTFLSHSDKGLQMQLSDSMPGTLPAGVDIQTVQKPLGLEFRIVYNVTVETDRTCWLSHYTDVQDPQASIEVKKNTQTLLSAKRPIRLNVQ